jgi:hypothetical protein
MAALNGVMRHSWCQHPSGAWYSKLNVLSGGLSVELVVRILRESMLNKSVPVTGYFR